MKHLLLLLAASVPLLTQAQLASPQWVRTAGGADVYADYLSAADVTGHFYTMARGEEMDYGNGISLTNIGSSIARYDSSGTISWARPLGIVPIEGFVFGSAIAPNGDGDLWVCGNFQGPTLTLDTIVLYNNGDYSAFLARYDSTGAVAFAKAWGGQGDGTAPSDLCVDALGQVRVTGTTFDASFTIGDITLADPAPGGQLYVLAFDADGNVQWGTISHGPDDYALGYCVRADATGNTYVVGVTHGWLTLGSDSVDAGIVLPQAVLIKLDPLGATERMDVVATCQPMDLEVDQVGNAYISGFLDNPAVFGGDTLVPSVLDGFVAAYDTEGQYRWVIGVQGESIDICSTMDLDAAQTGLAVGGSFTSSALFGGVLVETGPSSPDGFILRLDTAGTMDWVMNVSGDSSTFSSEAHLDPWDNLYVSGATQSALSFLGEPVLNGSGSHAYLARFGDFSTGVPATALVGGLQLYPNPCDGAFTIVLRGDTRSVLITDAQGREQERRTVRGAATSSFRLDGAGVYFVAVLSETGRTVTRVVVR